MSMAAIRIKSSYYNGRLPRGAPLIMPASQRYDLLHKRLDRFTRMLHGLDEGDVHALHRTRVASRRLREILPVLELDPDVARHLGRRLRKVTGRLGVVRELDVVTLLIEELHDSGKHDPATLAHIAAAIAEARARARDRLFAKLPTGELRRIAAKLGKLAGDLRDRKRPARGWRWAVEARLTHRATVLKDAMLEAGALYLPERLHIVRIALKKLRYALEVAVETTGAPSANDLRILKRGQDILGRLHDLQILIDRVRQIQASVDPPDLTLWRNIDVLTTALENDCRRLHARFMRHQAAVRSVCDRVSRLKVTASTRRAAAV
jgi:CHAD domain-containing protein